MAQRYLTYSPETKALRRMMRDTANPRFTRHAKQQMALPDRRISIPDVRKVLTNGQVRATEKDIRTGNEKWTVRGKDLDDRIIEVVIDVEHDPIAVVVTAFPKARI